MSYLLLLLFFVVEYVRPSSYVPALTVLRLNSLVPLGAFIGSLSSGTVGASGAWVWQDSNSKLVLSFLGLLAVSVMFADVQMYAFDRFTAVMGYVIIAWILFSELNTLDRIKGVFTALVVVHLLVAALNPVLFTNPEARNYIASGSFLGDGNDFALSVDLALPFCLFLMLNARVWVKPIWVAALLLMVACVVLSQSRGGTLGLGLMGLYYWAKSPKKVQTGLIAVVVVVLIIAMAPGAYFTRMQMMGDTEEGSAAARITAWKAATRMAIDNPFLGVGAGNFPTKFDTTYRPPDYDGPGKTAHSVYFLALGELGVPGMFIVVYFAFANLLANSRLAREVKVRKGAQAIEAQLLSSTSASLISYSIAAAFLSTLYYPHWFVLAGVMAAARQVVRMRLADSEPQAVTAPHADKVTIHPMLRPPARPALAPPVARQRLS